MFKKIISLISVILLMGIMDISSDDNIYGNNKEQIMKYLEESDFMDTIGKDDISIVDTIYTENSKIVGFLSDTGQGFLVFEKDEKGNYIMNDNGAQGISEENEGVTYHNIIYNYKGSLEYANKGFLVISNGKIVSNIELTINDKYEYSDSLEISKPSMVLFEEDLPKEESKETNANFRFFDINNKEVNPYE